MTIIALASISASSESLAQLQDSGWTTPVNLSLSGAASTPAIVVAPDGNLRIFWWDRFDGLTVAEGRLSGTSNSGIWSAPKAAPILLRETVQSGGQEEVVLTPITAMPRIVADTVGGAHALWLGEPDRETGAQALMYSQLQAGSTSWSSPTILADSVVGMDVAADDPDVIRVVYVTVQQTPDSPAGVYYRQSVNGRVRWTPPAALQQSRYLRLLTPDSVWVRLAVDDRGGIYVTWDDPHQDHALLAYSPDGGATWTAPQTIGGPAGRTLHGRVVPVSGGETLILWEAALAAEECSLYQAPAAELLTGSSGGGQRVLEGLATCPRNERFMPLGDGQILMVADVGSDVLTLVAWDEAQWSVPRQLSFRFEDPELGRQIYLSSLQAALIGPPSSADEGLADKTVLAIGTDQAGDVWVTSSQATALDLVFASPPPWSTPESFAVGKMIPALPAMAVDGEGQLHVLWSEAANSGEPGTALLYSHWAGGQWTRPASIRSGEGKAGQPALTVVGDRLHAVWSSSQDSGIAYSSAFARDAIAAAGWSDPQSLPGPSVVGTWPAVEADASGTLHVVYAVPLNEGRGIYYTRSTDGGQTWSAAHQVFDAAAAGWAMADHPRLAIDIQGLLHVVWVRAALPGSGLPQGVYYSRSPDGGETWTEPVAMIEGAFTWPQIAVNGPGQVHVLWNEATGQQTWWHQWSPDGGETWMRPARVPGFENVAGPAELMAGSNGALHLVGLAMESDGEWALRYAIWDGGRWSTTEPFLLGVENTVSGVTARLSPPLGRLEAVFRGEKADGQPAQMQLWHTGRLVPAVIVTPAPTFVPPPTATPSPTPAPTAAAPSPTAALGSTLPPTTGDSTEAILPLLLAGGLAAIVVAAILGMRLLRTAHR